MLDSCTVQTFIMLLNSKTPLYFNDFLEYTASLHYHRLHHNKDSTHRQGKVVCAHSLWLVI